MNHIENLIILAAFWIIFYFAGKIVDTKKKRKKAGLQFQSILKECENYKAEISKEHPIMMHSKVYKKLIGSIQECNEILEQDEEDYILEDIAEFVEEFDELVIDIKKDILKNEERRLKQQNTIIKERPKELMSLVNSVKNHPLYYSDKEKDFDLAMLSAKNILEKIGNLEKAKMDKLRRMGYREK
jgi:hypothetical protein